MKTYAKRLLLLLACLIPLLTTSCLVVEGRHHGAVVAPVPIVPVPVPVPVPR